MISGAMIWGYLFDTLGRKRLLICGFLLDGAFVLLSSFSQSLTPLVIYKFLGGFMWVWLSNPLTKIHIKDYLFILCDKYFNYYVFHTRLNLILYYFIKCIGIWKSKYYSKMLGFLFYT